MAFFSGVHCLLPVGTVNNVQTLKASINWAIARQLWALYGKEFGPRGTGTLQGFYTDVEESNTIGELARMKDLVGHYLEPVARDIHGMVDLNNSDGSHRDAGGRSGAHGRDVIRGAVDHTGASGKTATQRGSSTTLVWASPYFVGNKTRGEGSPNYMNPRFYADWWGQVFVEAPHIDLIAPQDSMGAQGNSFQNVTDYETQLALISKENGRQMWSNVELFQVSPPGCPWSPTTGMCKGRAPAPFERIKAQMANESPLVDKLIAWEWHSCLSPHGSSNLTTVVYKQYLDYIDAGRQHTA
jgi:hypothetical protein